MLQKIAFQNRASFRGHGYFSTLSFGIYSLGGSLFVVVVVLNFRFNIISFNWESRILKDVNIQITGV